MLDTCHHPAGHFFSDGSARNAGQPDVTGWANDRTRNDGRPHCGGGGEYLSKTEPGSGYRRIKVRYHCESDQRGSYAGDLWCDCDSARVLAVDDSGGDGGQDVQPSCSHHRHFIDGGAICFSTAITGTERIYPKGRIGSRYQDRRDP